MSILVYTQNDYITHVFPPPPKLSSLLSRLYIRLLRYTGKRITVAAHFVT